jgi:hypothetical protein
MRRPVDPHAARILLGEETAAPMELRDRLGRATRRATVASKAPIRTR